MAINLDELKLISATLEVRYAPQFAVWDRSGAIWTEVSQSYPSIRHKQAEPNSVTVELEDKLSALISIDRAHVTSQLPGAGLPKLKEATDAIITAFVKYVPVQFYTRIGMRLIYQKVFRGREEAADYVLSVVDVESPSRKIMNIAGRRLDPIYAMKWEGDALGVSIKLSASQSRLDAEFPVEFASSASPVEATLNQALLDIDYYSHAQLSVDQLVPSELIENWLRVIKRDIGNATSGQ